MGDCFQHNHEDIDEAQKIARSTTPPMGLIFRNQNIPTYGDVRYSKVMMRTPQEKVDAMNAELDKYTI